MRLTCGQEAPTFRWKKHVAFEVNKETILVGGLKHMFETYPFWDDYRSWQPYLLTGFKPPTSIELALNLYEFLKWVQMVWYGLVRGVYVTCTRNYTNVYSNLEN